MLSTVRDERTGLYLAQRAAALDNWGALERQILRSGLSPDQQARFVRPISGGSFLTGTSSELVYANRTSFTAKNTFTAEVQINDTAAEAQALLPPWFFMPGAQGVAKAVRIVARGILSSTATPTYTFTCRLGAAATTSAVIGLGSAALTTGSGVTNQLFEFEGDIIVRTLGTTGATGTGNGLGLVTSPGLASPFAYALFGGAASPGTFTTLDPSITNFINFNVTCSASSASNTITLLQLLVYGQN